MVPCVQGRTKECPINTISEAQKKWEVAKKETWLKSTVTAKHLNKKTIPFKGMVLNYVEACGLQSEVRLG